jgi:hypothetical protein
MRNLRKGECQIDPGSLSFASQTHKWRRLEEKPRARTVAWFEGAEFAHVVYGNMSLLCFPNRKVSGRHAWPWLLHAQPRVYRTLQCQYP